jgi:hypothetical protein
MRTIELVVSPSGETTLETKGYSGDACRNASAFLEAALGFKQSDQPTAEALTAADQTPLHQSS